MLAGSNGTSTHGWDTVYAVRFSDLNKTIISHKTSPTAFEQVINDPDEGEEYRVSGQFGDWQLTVGGDGKNVYLAVPILKSTLVTNRTYDCSLITLTIEVNLAWVSSAPAATAGMGARHVLQLKDTAPERAAAGATAHASDRVAIVGVDWGSNQLSELKHAAYRALLGNWLAEHVGAFRHVFSTLDLNQELSADAQALQWLMPTGTPLYAVVDLDESLEKSMFGVLCMTENRPAPGNHQLDPFAIPDGANSGFLINAERVLDKMLLPGMPHLFIGNVSVQDFTLSPDGLSLQNAKRLQFADQRLPSSYLYPLGHTVQPFIDAGNFRLEMSGGKVNMTMDGVHFEFSPGITVSIVHTSSVRLTLNENRQFRMDLTGPANTSANISTALWVTLTEVTAGIIASVILSAAGGILGASVSGGGAVVRSGTIATVRTVITIVKDSVKGAVSNLGARAFQAAASTLKGGAGEIGSLIYANWAKIVGTIIGGTIGGSIGTISSIITLIAKDKASEIPTLDEFGTQAMSPIGWPNTTPDGFELVSGQLNGALQIGFNLAYKHD